MFTKLSTAFVAVLALSVAAAPQSSSPSNQCNSQDIQCCDSVQSAGSGGLVLDLLDFLGVGDIGADVPIGVTCSPITGIGAGGGSSCAAQPVCCTDNSFNGVIAIGCTPININL